MARHIHRHCESGLQTIGNPTAEICLRRVGDRVEQEIETAPFFPDVREHCFELTRLAHIAQEQYPPFELLSEWSHAPFGPRIQKGNGELRTGARSTSAQP